MENKKSSLSMTTYSNICVPHEKTSSMLTFESPNVTYSRGNSSRKSKCKRALHRELDRSYTSKTATVASLFEDLHPNFSPLLIHLEKKMKSGEIICNEDFEENMLMNYDSGFSSDIEETGNLIDDDMFMEIKEVLSKSKIDLPNSASVTQSQNENIFSQGNLMIIFF